jgi:hypothetical protein
MGSTTIVRSEPGLTDRAEGIRPRREEIETQLARLLASPLFNHSRHYPSLLRYVVNETLEGRGSHLKERALGVEVFGRDADYDTNADPVVRTSASEVRKRIAQYYHKSGHEDEIRIDLPSGSYIPEFRFAPVRPLPIAVDDAPVPAAPPVRVVTIRDVAQRRSVRVIAAAAAAAILGIGAIEMPRKASPLESFWGPVWGSPDSVMVAVGGTPRIDPPPTNAIGLSLGPSFREVMRGDSMAFSDALTMARVNGVAREFGKKKLDIRRASVFTLTDLRKGPVVLIGAFNNTWTMRLNSDLRFSYWWNNETHTGGIRDKQNPTNHNYVHDPSVPYSELTKDYAVVSRFSDSLTEKVVVVVGGMGRDATIAAGEFVTDPKYLGMLADRAPAHWERKNLQVLIGTDVVNGNTGPPQIIATYFW